jgi:hypothetical protein
VTSEVRSKGRSPVGHGELSLRPKAGDVSDLREELGRRQLGNPRYRRESRLEPASELSDLLGDLIELLGELSQPRHPVSGDPSTNAIVAGQQPSCPVDVAFGRQPTDPPLVSRVKLLQVSVEPVGHPVALGPQLPAVTHQDAQVLELAVRTDLGQIWLPQRDPSDQQSIDRVGLGLRALTAPRLGRELRRNPWDPETRSVV